MYIKIYVYLVVYLYKIRILKYIQLVNVVAVLLFFGEKFIVFNLKRIQNLIFLG